MSLTGKLDSEHYEMLAKGSGISDDVIKERGYYTERVKSRLAELGFGRSQQITPSLVIPLYRPNGKNGTYQIRPDHPRALKGKPHKYEFPFGVAVQLDISPVDWVIAAMKDPKIPLIFTEGSKKADAATSRGILCVAAIGVWNFRGTNEHGGKCTVSDLDDIALNDRDVSICYDSDVMEKKEVHRAMVRLAGVLANRGAKVSYIYLPPCTNGSKQGLDDFFVNGGTVPEFWAHKTSELRQIEQSNEGTDDMSLSMRLKPDFDGKVGYDDTIFSWFTYDESKWVEKSIPRMKSIFMHKIHELTGDGVSHAKVVSVMNLMAGELVRDFKTDSMLVPMQNGVLNMETMVLQDHSPDYNFTWCLPYGYDPDATCERTQHYLAYLANGDPVLEKALVAFIRATLLGKYNLKRYLELIGDPDTGKSTFIRLLTALVGRENTVSVNLPDLGNRFIVSSFYRKRLVVMSDQAGYIPFPTQFKQLTGGDDLTLERKHVQGTGGTFTFEGMVAISANEPLQIGDSTLGMPSRSFRVNLENPPARREQLLEFVNGKPVGKLAPELPGLFNLAMTMTEAEMEDYLATWGGKHESLRRSGTVSHLDTNAILAWASERLVYVPGEETQIGSKGGNPNHIYTDYYAYCEQTGRHPTSQSKFIYSLMQISRQYWKGKNIEKVERRANKKVITNIRIRRDTDTHPNIITGDPVEPCEIVEGSFCELVNRTDLTLDGNMIPAPIRYPCNGR